MPVPSMSSKQKSVLLMVSWADPRFLRGIARYAKGAGWHLNIILLPIIVAAALVICFIRYKTKSLIPCIIIHMMNNILAVSYYYFFD